MHPLFALSFDPSVNLGTVLAVIVLLLNQARMHTQNVKSLAEFRAVVTTKLDVLWKEFEDRR